ncbi:hypothetical protein KM043_009797 [Ampulex compressa]|nr:hypothetical protein KM043_009797 [Ampulex compressa]
MSVHTQSSNMDPNDKRTIFERFLIFMQTDTGKVVSYGIASAGLLGALYHIRPFAKFRRPSSVPSHFIRSQVPLKGVVKSIDLCGDVVLMVDHKPLLPLPRFSKNNLLPVRIAGISVTSNGICWLQTLASEKKVVFTAISKKPDYLDCLVTLPYKNEGNLNLGEELVKLGFATVKPLEFQSQDNKYIELYTKSLTKGESWAKLRRNGYWQSVLPHGFFWRIQKLLETKIQPRLRKLVSKHAV